MKNFKSLFVETTNRETLLNRNAFLGSVKFVLVVLTLAAGILLAIKYLREDDHLWWLWLLVIVLVIIYTRFISWAEPFTSYRYSRSGQDWHASCIRDNWSSQRKFFGGLHKRGDKNPLW